MREKKNTDKKLDDLKKHELVKWLGKEAAVFDPMPGSEFAVIRCAGDKHIMVVRKKDLYR